MPNDYKDTLVYNDTEYDIHDARISNADITTWNSAKPVYIVPWLSYVQNTPQYNPDDVAANVAKLNEMFSLNVGEYFVYMRIQYNHIMPAFVEKISGSTNANRFKVFAFDLDADGNFSVYEIKGTQASDYVQTRTSTVEVSQFDDFGTNTASQSLIAQYVDSAIQSSAYTLPTASASTLGGVKIGSNVSIDGNGAISVAAPYVLPAATSSALGGVKVGSTLKMDNNNVLDVNTTIVADTTHTTSTVPLTNGREFRFTQDLSSLTITSTGITIGDDLLMWIVFPSGSTATSITYPSSFKWSGDDVSANTFVPAANTTYNICIWYDGININAIARGA